MENKSKPLHLRIKDAEGFNEEQRKSFEKNKLETQALLHRVFGSEDGQKVLDILISTYLTRDFSGSMTPNEIMYAEGQNSVIKQIIKQMEKIDVTK